MEMMVVLKGEHVVLKLCNWGSKTRISMKKFNFVKDFVMVEFGIIEDNTISFLANVRKEGKS